MKKNYFLTLLFTLCISTLAFAQDLVITGVFDGPLSGGTPKGVELFVINDIADLSIYGIGSANNGQGSDGEEFTFPAVSATNGTYLYLASDEAQFTAFFGFAPDYNAGSAMGINGDDAIELFMNGAVIDLYGDIDVIGDNEVWDYTDGWAYRKSGTGPSPTFTPSDWIYSGKDALDGETSNATASTPFPSKTYTTVASTTPTLIVGSAVSGLDYFQGNGPSAEKEFSVSGDNLTNDLTVTAPTNFEVSLTSGANFSNTVSLSPASGAVAISTIYVRLVAGLSVNTYTGDVTVASTGASSKTVAVSGEVSPADPQFFYSAFLDDFTYTNGAGPSDEQTFTVEGLFLTDDLVVTAPTDFEVSLSTGTGFGSSVSIIPSSGTVANTTIYIRLSVGLSEGSYSGDVTLSSTSVTDKTFSVNGNVFGAATNSMVITGIYDGPLSGGTPKGVELYVLKDIADLSLFGVSSVSNGGGSTAGNVEFSFPAGSATAGTYIYVATEDTNFTTFFGFAPTYTTGSVGINGDDSIELYENGQIIDVYGDVDAGFSGEDYDYLDGWAYRKSNTGPEGTTFSSENWIYSGINVFDGETTNATATTPFPIGTYTNNTASVSNNSIEGFATFPNPVTNKRFIIISNSSDKKEVTIFNVLGKKVFSTNFSSTKADIDVSTISSGIYILKVTEGSKSASSKLIVR